MKAVIMAGGEGRRLRPLTADMPKPMLKLCGKPVLEYILKLLEKHGVDEAWLTLGYKSEKIIDHFKNGTFAGVKLNFIVEKTPLGTAGGVKSAIGETDEDFIVISGDALCDVDLTAALNYHRVKSADVTIITRRVSDPREYGLADISADGQVRGFLEKPGWSDAFTDMANTGIYILSGLCCKNIKDGVYSDFAKDVFPTLVTKNSLYAYRSDGYWRDIGDINAYVEAQRDLINGKVNCEVEGERIGGCIYAEGKPKGNFSIDAPCYIGKNVRIGDGAVIGENSSVGDDVIIGAHARTSGCVLMDGAVVGENSLSRGCVVCEGGGIGRGATAATGSVIGPRSLLGDDAVLGENVVLQEFEVVPDETIVVETPEKTAPQLPVIGDNVITGRLGTVITPQFCLRIGQSLASVCGDRPICVADDGLNASYIHKQALMAGILAEGGQVYDTGVMFAGQLSFAVIESGAVMGVLIGGYGQGIKFIGASIPNALQKQIEALIVRNAAPTKGGVVRLPEILSGVSALWENRLVSSLPRKSIDFAGSFFCKNSIVAEAAAKIFMQLGGKSGGDMSFNFTADGAETNVSRGGEIILKNEQIVSICAAYDFQKGADVVVTHSAPRVLEKIGEQFGKRVYRQTVCRETCVWSCDGVSALLYALSCTGSDTVLMQLAESLPEVAVYSEEAAIEGGSAQILGKILSRDGGVRTERGVAMPTSAGWITVRPSADGKTIKIITEATSTEVARELCGDFEKWLDL